MQVDQFCLITFFNAKNESIFALKRIVLHQVVDKIFTGMNNTIKDILRLHKFAITENQRPPLR